jgi:ribosomal protein S18 acetylase RimI-like enzyme
MMIRAAKAGDAPRVGEIHVDGWRAAYRGIIPDSFLAGLSAEQRAAGWKSAIEKDPGSVLVHEKDGAIVGWAAVGKSRDGIEGAGELFAIYVDPACWRQGCGRQLMEAAEATLWARGHRFCLLWVLEKNLPARAFYRRLGYVEDGGRKSESIGGVELTEIRVAKARPSQATETDVKAALP